MSKVNKNRRIRTNNMHLSQPQALSKNVRRHFEYFTPETSCELSLILNGLSNNFLKISVYFQFRKLFIIKAHYYNQ